MTYRHLTFIAMLLVCVILEWISGYDFNYHGVGVAFIVAMSLLFSFFISLLSSKEKIKLWNI